MKRIGNVPEGSVLVNADVVGPYPSIPHKEGILALKSKLEEQNFSKIPTNDLDKLAEFFLKNNFFEFSKEIKQQISGTTIRTKFSPPCACIYMHKTEADFLEWQELQPFVWLRYIDGIFFIWTHGEVELKKFMKGLYRFFGEQFTYESSKKRVALLDLTVSLENG